MQRDVYDFWWKVVISFESAHMWSVDDIVHCLVLNSTKVLYLFGYQYVPRNPFHPFSELALFSDLIYHIKHHARLIVQTRHPETND
jgi:hypothetical protein